MTTNPPPDARNARIYVATANVAIMDILSDGEHQVTALNQTITVKNEGGSTASETAGRNDSGKRQRRARRLRQPASGDKHVLGLHAAPTGTLTGSEQFGPGPFGEAFHVAGRPTPQSGSAVLPMPAPPPQHQHPAQLVTGRRQHALQRERSRTGWPAYGVHVNSAVSFSVLTTIAHVSVRVALAAPNSACRPAGIARTSPDGTLCPPGPR